MKILRGSQLRQLRPAGIQIEHSADAFMETRGKCLNLPVEPSFYRPGHPIIALPREVVNIASPESRFHKKRCARLFDFRIHVFLLLKNYRRQPCHVQYMALVLWGGSHHSTHTCAQEATVLASMCSRNNRSASVRGQ